MYVIVDTETTGLVLPAGTKLELQPRMTEIAIITLDENLNVEEEYTTLINPGIPIPELITKITGINDSMVRNKPTFSELYPDIIPYFFGKQYFIGHNATFDQSIIYFDLLRINKHCNFPWPPNTYCTVEQSLHLRGYRLKLGELYQLATGKAIVGAHRAINDTRATVDVLRWLKEGEQPVQKKRLRRRSANR